MLLMTNVDNINVDQVPYLIERLMEKGAGNVHVLTALTKKGRQEYIFLIDAPEDQTTSIAGFLASEIGTLGIRILKADHMSFQYFMVNKRIKLKDNDDQLLWEGSVKVKIVKDEFENPLSARVEYEDLKAVAKSLEGTGANINFYELKQMIETEVIRNLKYKEFKLEFDS
ncbi:MAG: hypothetical protein APF84_01515 [Gracilibacter sp. BRH_c7a]|nr:MAG: hypothetical protein APF84_01515 [Gracilibacter sp. BRH_c7a]